MDIQNHERNHIEKTLFKKYPSRQFYDATTRGNDLIFNMISDGYSFKGFYSNKKIEEKGVKHFIKATNKEEVIFIGYSKKQNNWLISENDYINNKNRFKLEELLEELTFNHFEIKNIESYFDRILVEDKDLLVGAKAENYQNHTLYIIPILSPDDPKKTIWTTTEEKLI